MTVATTSLGVPGYTFADLHEPERLASLHERFCEEVSAADPALWREWDAYRQAPDAPWPPVTLSNLLIAMAPHVSRFVRRLFEVDAPMSALVAATRVQDDLFRFKVDFVRRRALPLLKNGATVVSTPEDEAIVANMIGGWRPGQRPRVGDCQGWLCAAGRRKNSSAHPQSAIHHPQLDALKRWCAVRLHDRAYRHWVVFRFPETVEPFHLVEVERPDPTLPEAHDRSRLAAAATRRFHADRWADASARSAERDSLLRPVPRARQGLVFERAARQGWQGRR